MSALLSTPTEWGVRHRTSRTGVDECANEAIARRYQHALRYCGNADAVLVARAASDAAWIPMGGAS